MNLSLRRQGLVIDGAVSCVAEKILNLFYHAVEKYENDKDVWINFYSYYDFN